MEHRFRLSGQKHHRFAFCPLCQAPRERVQAYLTDVYAIVCGGGLTRREARRLAFRLWEKGEERQRFCRQASLSVETRLTLLCLADAFLSENEA